MLVVAGTTAEVQFNARFDGRSVSVAAARAYRIGLSVTGIEP
jgi:hypothetical protein